MKSRLQSISRRFDELLDQILNEHVDSKKVEENKDLVDVQLEDMFAARTDTTFITPDWGMIEILMNPMLWKRHYKNGCFRNRKRSSLL
ncbi:hypothetical protein Lal_00002272 [Lupinus albus]|nr:hypothetical protein Lal_00002272 [Lupinus albus]